MGTPFTRYTQRIFGSGAGSNQIKKFGSLFAGTPANAANAGDAMSLSNWLTGWFGAAIGGNAPAIEDMNAFCFATSYQLAYVMQQGIPAWDSGTSYYTNQFVSSGGNIYVSKTDDNLGNAVTDTTNWKLFAGEPVGIGKDYWGTTAPSGYVFASGRTIGNASSNATERADADCFDLFSLLWTAYSNTDLPIYLSNGSLSVRGASALADWTANKAITLIDKRGRVSVGKDNMGGTAANRITSAAVGIDGTKLGAAGGEQTHTLIIAEMPAHNHKMIQTGGTVQNIPFNSAGSSLFTPTNGPGVTVDNYGPTASTGGDGAHNNVQPTIVCNYIIKL